MVKSLLDNSNCALVEEFGGSYGIGLAYARDMIRPACIGASSDA